MKKYLVVLMAVLAWACMPKEARASVTVTGKIQYTRNWNGGNTGLGHTGLLTGALTGVAPLKDVQVCVVKSTSKFCGAFTDNSGNFSLTANIPAGVGYTLRVTLAGQSRVTPGALGYHVTQSNGSVPENLAPFVISMGSFTVPASGTVSAGTNTLNPCTPAIAFCPNDMANGQAAMQLVVSRWTTFTFSNISGFNAGLDHFVARSDQTLNSECGFSGAKDATMCFNFDFGSADIITAAHESGHTIQAIIESAKGTQTPVTLDKCASGDTESSADILSEALANFNSMVVLYDISNIATFSNFQDFCFTSNEPAGDELNNCTSCEFQPSFTFYPLTPLANTCSLDPTQNVRLTECRGMKMLLDLTDAVTVNGTDCLSEGAQINYWNIMDQATNFGIGNGPGQASEQAFGSPDTGTAVRGRDASGMMDLLKKIHDAGLITGATAYKIWANGCYMPGDANWGSDFTLPASDAVGPPY